MEGALAPFFPKPSDARVSPLAVTCHTVWLLQCRGICITSGVFTKQSRGVDRATGDPLWMAGSWAGPDLISGPQSGFLTALLMGVTFICTILGGLLADFLLSRKVLSLVVIRKLFTAIGQAPGAPGGGGLGSSGPCPCCSVLILLPQGSSSRLCSPCPCPGSDPALVPPWPSWGCPTPPSASAKWEFSSTSWTWRLGRFPLAPFSQKLRSHG